MANKKIEPKVEVPQPESTESPKPNKASLLNKFLIENDIKLKVDPLSNVEVIFKDNKIVGRIIRDPKITVDE